MRNFKDEVKEVSGPICGITLADTDVALPSNVNHIIPHSLGQLQNYPASEYLGIPLEANCFLEDPLNCFMTLKHINSSIWDFWWCYVDEKDSIKTDDSDNPRAQETLNYVMRKGKSAFGQKFQFSERMTEDKVNEQRMYFKVHKMLYDVVHLIGDANGIADEYLSDSNESEIAINNNNSITEKRNEEVRLAQKKEDIIRYIKAIGNIRQIRLNPKQSKKISVSKVILLSTYDDM